MSFNSKAYLEHQERLSDPESNIVRGTRKRFKEAPAWKQKGDAMAKLKEEMGADEFYRRIREGHEKSQQVKEYNS